VQRFLGFIFKGKEKTAVVLGRAIASGTSLMTRYIVELRKGTFLFEGR